MATTAHPAPATFTHPGMLHNAGDINRARVRVAAGTAPWLSGWNRPTANSRLTWTNRATATIVRGGTGQNYSLLAMYYDLVEPEGGGGDYGSHSGGYDQLGFGTPMYAK